MFYENTVCSTKHRTLRGSIISHFDDIYRRQIAYEIQNVQKIRIQTCLGKNFVSLTPDRTGKLILSGFAIGKTTSRVTNIAVFLLRRILQQSEIKIVATRITHFNPWPSIFNDLTRYRIIVNYKITQDIQFAARQLLAIHKLAASLDTTRCECMRIA